MALCLKSQMLSFWKKKIHRENWKYNEFYFLYLVKKLKKSLLEQNLMSFKDQLWKFLTLKNTVLLLYPIFSEKKLKKFNVSFKDQLWKF